jgi:hypothetical protein
VALVQSLCTRDKLEVATGRYIAAQSTRQLSWLQVVLSSNATYTENLAVLDIAHNSSLNQSLKIDPRPHYCGHYHMRDVFGAHHHLHGQSMHYWRPNSPRCDLLPPTWQYERLPNREPDWAIGRALQFGVPIRQSRDIRESRMKIY